MQRHCTRRRRSRRTRAVSLLLLSLSITVGATGQEGIPSSTAPPNGALVTDRPDFTESAAALDPHRVQLETGYTYQEAGNEQSHSFGELLVRIGWTENLELRLGLNSYGTVRTPAGDSSGLEDGSIGVKIELTEGADEPHLLAPQAALLAGTSIPTGDDSQGASHLQPNLTLALAWPLTERLGLGSNLGLTWASADGEKFLEGIASLALGASLTDAMGGYVEYYVFLPESSAGSPDQFVDTGVTYLITDDFQIDLRIGTQVGGGPTDFFAGAGLAYRW